MNTAPFSVCLSAALLLLAPAGAQAQSPIFFDDFSGTVLGPHWTMLPNPEYMTYTVSNGRLTVDWIRTPLGHPWGNAHGGGFRADFPTHAGDFEATITMGWETGSQRQVHLSLLTPPSFGLARMAYSDLSGNVTGAVGPTNFVFPNVPPGVHDLRVRRQGMQAEFFLNNQVFGSTGIGDQPLGAISLGLTFIHPGSNFQPVFFESILIVPSPAPASVVAVALLFIAVRRRRS